MSNHINEIKNEIEKYLETFNNNNIKLNSKYNEGVYSFNLEEEKKFIKEIKLFYDENINIIKILKTILLINNKNNNNNDKIPEENEFKNYYIELFKNSIKYFYRGSIYYKERLTLKMFEKYRIIKPDLKDSEIELALQDSSPDQIFFKTSFGFSFSESAKSALVYIQYRHHDLKTLDITIKEIQIVSKQFNINWDLSVESSSFTIKKNKILINNQQQQFNKDLNNNGYNSPSSFSSSLTIGNDIIENEKKKKNEEENAKNSVILLKKQLRNTSNTRRFIFLNIWCCGE